MQLIKRPSKYFLTESSNPLRYARVRATRPPRPAATPSMADWLSTFTPSTPCRFNLLLYPAVVVVVEPGALSPGDDAYHVPPPIGVQSGVHLQNRRAE